MAEEKSMSPTEEGQSPKPDTMNFSQAIAAVMKGEKVRRLEWPDESVNGKLETNTLKIIIARGQYADWIISDGDLEAEDWVTV